jgi:protein-L-isoaspartate(D-aspartate) O-methyltransferase
MSEFERARENMVESQVRPSDVTDLRIQDAMRTLPRERFVPKGKAAIAYLDEPVEIAPGRWLMDPRSFAKLVHAAQIEDDEDVLVIGSGLGYSAAVLGHMAEAVVAVESDTAMAEAASQNLLSLGIDNAAVVTGALEAGYPKQGPYSVIVIDGGVETIPAEIEDQLKDGGRLVAIVLQGPIGKATVFTKSGDAVSGREVFDATVPLLPGFERERGFVF